jgi:hypothetical protein
MPLTLLWAHSQVLLCSVESVFKISKYTTFKVITWVCYSVYYPSIHSQLTVVTVLTTQTTFPSRSLVASFFLLFPCQQNRTGIKGFSFVSQDNTITIMLRVEPPRSFHKRDFQPNPNNVHFITPMIQRDFFPCFLPWYNKAGTCCGPWSAQRSCLKKYFLM